VFCGVLRVFCDVLRVFGGVLRRVFHCSISTKHTNHPKNIEKHWKTQKTHNTLVYCGSFPRAKKFDCIAKNTFHKTSAKHRKTPQNSHKTHFVKLRRKTLQNARKTLENVTKRSQYSRNTYSIHIARIRCFIPKYARRSVAKAHNTQYTRKLREEGRVSAGGHLARL